ncbi:MAG TPA: fumarylacetoacetate hydrolase family protein, partial [Stellaceae bacterium]|nr:fumarylacetoacetate hydrolase family protein [Stellaceae bacterium]
MRLVSYHTRDHSGVGVMVDDHRFVSLRRAAPDLPGTLKRILELGPAVLKAIEAAAKGRDPDFRFDQVTLDPVVPEPHATWALALNFKAHIEETGLTTSKDYPQIFMRMPCSVVGHLEPLWCPDPRVAETFDYEGELA